MIKCLPILLILIGTRFSVDAQANLELRAYTNYGSCYQGLKTLNGKVIWPADFESLEHIWDMDYSSHPYRYVWRAEKNGSFGVIDTNGKLLIPFNYSRINVFRTKLKSGFIAIDDSAAYILSTDGKVELKLYGYTSLRPTPDGYVFEMDGKFGFMGSRMNIILEANYDRIDQCEVRYRQEGIDEVISSRFLNVYTDQGNAIFDIYRNKWTIPVTTDYIYHKWVTDCSSSDAIFYLSNKNTGEQGILNSNGVEMHHLMRRDYVEVQLTPLDSCGTASHQLAYLEENKKMKVLDLKTGKTSSEYSEIHAVNGYSIFFEEKKWGVIDSNLVELKRLPYPKYNKEWLSDYLESPQRSKANARASVLFAGYYNRRIDSVLITREERKESSKYEESDIYGLVNFRTGKRIKPLYSHIGHSEYNGQTYYWATTSIFYAYEMGSSTNSLDIFDADLHLLKQFKDGVLIGRASSRYQEAHQIIYNKEKAGVINPRGDEVIPIKFTEVSRLEVLSKDNILKYETLFVVSHDTAQVLYDYDGKLLVDKNYSRFVSAGTFIRAFRKDHLNDLYNSAGELLVEGVKYYRESPRIDEYGKCIGIEDKVRFAPRNCTYVTKDDELYQLLDGKAQLLDASFFKFRENYCYFLEWILIDRSGKIVTTNPQGISKLYASYRRDNPTECSTYLKEYPVPVKEVTPSKPQKEYVPKPVPQKQFVWKQHSTKKANEWFLYNGNGLLLYPESFEYPLKEVEFQGGTFQQNGKFGFFDSQYNKYLSAEYDYIYPYAPLTFKNGKWQVHWLYAKKISAEYDNIATTNRNKLRFVFDNGKIGLLNDSLQLEIPLTDSIAFLQKYDLVKLLNYNAAYRMKTPHVSSGVVFLTEPKEVYRKINNRIILEAAYSYSTANDPLTFSAVDFYRSDLPQYLKDLKFHHNAVAQQISRTPTYYNQYFYSEMTLSWEERWSADYSNYGWLDDRYKYREVFNYKIVGNNLVKINLSDILKTDAASTKKLDELMTRELTRIQAFGGDCTDMESKLAKLKENFLINGYRISFFWPERGGFQIELVFSELKGLILEPTKLKSL